MKKAALTFGLFSLVMVATSFATPQTTSSSIKGIINTTLETDGGGDAHRDRVEAGERLVVHDQFRIERGGADHGHAARHAAGNLTRFQLGGIAQTDRVELHQHQVADQLFRQIGMLAQGKRDVVKHGQIGEQRAELEQHAHFAAQTVPEPPTIDRISPA